MSGTLAVPGKSLKKLRKEENGKCHLFLRLTASIMDGYLNSFYLEWISRTRCVLYGHHMYSRMLSLTKVVVHVQQCGGALGGDLEGCMEDSMRVIHQEHLIHRQVLRNNLRPGKGLAMWCTIQKLVESGS